MKSLLAATAVIGLLAATPAHAAFTLSNNNFGDGYIAGAYPSFDLWGANNGVGGNFTTYTDTSASAQSVKFNWVYNSYDCCSSSYDPAGYVIDGVYTQLSVDGVYGSQAGTATITLNPGDTFGWYVYSTDSILGAGEITINATPAPEPVTVGLLGVGLGAIGAVRRRRR